MIPPQVSLSGAQPQGLGGWFVHWGRKTHPYVTLPGASKHNRIGSPNEPLLPTMMPCGVQGAHDEAHG